MKTGTINFGGSIFRRRNDQQRTASNEQADQELLAQRLADRKITLKQDDLKPLTKETPPLDWATVNGEITLPATAIEGLLQGQPRVSAQHLKSLIPPPIGPEVPDATEYAGSLAAIIQQIQDLLQPAEAAPHQQPEFETPFTALAKEDSLRFASGNNKKEKANPPPKRTRTNHPKSKDPPQLFEPTPRRRTIPSNLPPKLSISKIPQPHNSRQKASRPRKTITPLHTKHLALTLKNCLERSDRAQADNAHWSQRPGAGPAGALADGPRYEPAEQAAHRGVEQLQQIFMVDQPFDGTRVAFLVRQFPGVTGALILLQGGAVLGGQLPDPLDLEAALQAPEVLAHFFRFIVELEAGRTAESRLLP